ncbi:YbaN family protein [Enterococcus sp. BWR-S5]|uniref:YbaN family protein n=1 Tax=Enterococcus sp. BWR-S5 TaxID=2787714 RepID=UPI0019218BCD|nr:YbaN family protein [Enterococcus sp. BWR-S5]MBL1225063.1 YbaN family protein [Enterococcus sp. BWR-S5]
MKKGLFILSGTITFILGTIGIFLPFLPTTVFYLLTGFFWLRSSEKLYHRFIQSKRYQKYVEEPIIKKNISTGNMIKMFLAIFVVFLIPCIFVDNLMMRVTMAIVYIAHVVLLTWYLKGKNRNTVSVKAGSGND